MRKSARIFTGSRWSCWSPAVGAANPGFLRTEPAGSWAISIPLQLRIRAGDEAFHRLSRRDRRFRHVDGRPDDRGGGDDHLQRRWGRSLALLCIALGVRANLSVGLRDHAAAVPSVHRRASAGAGVFRRNGCGTRVIPWTPTSATVFGWMINGMASSNGADLSPSCCWGPRCSSNARTTLGKIA